MSKHVEWHTKPCSVPGHCLLIGPSVGRHELSLQMPIETAEYIVRACNSYDALIAACKAMQKQWWMTTAGIHVAGTLPAQLRAIGKQAEAAIKNAEA